MIAARLRSGLSYIVGKYISYQIGVALVVVGVIIGEAWIIFLVALPKLLRLAQALL